MAIPAPVRSLHEVKQPTGAKQMERMMECLNKIQLRGTVGSCRTEKIGNAKVARLSVATNYAYRNEDGEAVIETTWHGITAREGERIKCLDRLAKGVVVEVEGRLREVRYTSSTGEERTCPEIIAYTLRVFGDDDPEIR